MPILRETPYSAFNFLVELGSGNAQEVVAGFSEVSGLNAEVTIAEYRNGNSKVSYVNKIAGMNKSGDVTLKRGVIGDDSIWNWLNTTRQGSQDAKRDVQIKMMNENRSDVVVSWTLRGAQPIKWTGPTLAGKGGSDVAMEEIVLSIESIEQE
ncbi:MAG: phage tail protein [Gammaproteobacteria bacterium]|nr:phage tail protein [Gammaproteobacteria bacterium]